MGLIEGNKEDTMDPTSPNTKASSKRGDATNLIRDETDRTTTRRPWTGRRSRWRSRVAAWSQQRVQFSMEIKQKRLICKHY